MKNDLRSILKEAKLKVTPARLSILEIFSRSLCKPINAEDIHGKLKGEDRNLVTVYRTLTSFEKSGVIERVDLRKDSIYYEMASHHHHHIVCTGCGKTESFEACDVEKISNKILQKSPLFKTVSRHSLELFGLCITCSKR